MLLLGILISSCSIIFPRSVLMLHTCQSQVPLLSLLNIRTVFCKESISDHDDNNIIIVTTTTYGCCEGGRSHWIILYILGLFKAFHEIFFFPNKGINCMTISPLGFEHRNNNNITFEACTESSWLQLK